MKRPRWGLVSISRDLDTSSLGDLKMVGLQRVVEWVHGNLEIDLSVEALARIANNKFATGN